MSLSLSLALVIVAFLVLMTSVMWLAFRERRAGRRIAADDTAAQNASDARVLVVIFGAMIGGMLLMLLTAWLIFF